MLKIWEKILINEAKNGNLSAYTQLYNHYFDKIYRFIYFRVGNNREIAEDLAAQTFLNFLNYFKEEKDISDFNSFIFKIARNLVIDKYREEKEADLDLEEIEKEANLNYNLEEEIEKKITIENIKQCLKNLSPAYREIIILKFIEEMSYPEIAKIVNRPENTVRVMAHRGIKMLKQEVSKMNY